MPKMSEVAVHLLFVIVISVLFENGNAEDALQDNMSDWQQPIYHISPQYGWMNDPTGIVPVMDSSGAIIYHFFFDSNPNNTLPPWDPSVGYGVWSHIHGQDLVRWQYDAPTTIRSGTGGMFANTNATFPYVAVAFSGSQTTDNGASAWTTTDPGLNTWQAINGGAPIVTLDMVPKEIRAGYIGDNYGWYNATEGVFYMLVGSNQCPNNTSACSYKTPNALPQALLFQSTDLQSWNFTSVFWIGTAGDANRCDCVDTYQLRDGRQVFMFLDHGDGGARTVWMLGSLDSETKEFTEESRGYVDLGKVSATRSFFDSSDRRILFGWIPTPAHGAVAGTQTLPREITVGRDGLTFAPIEEISSLRGKQQHYEVNITNGTYELSGVDTQSFEFHITADRTVIGLNETFGIQLLGDADFSSFLQISVNGTQSANCTSPHANMNSGGGEHLLNVTITDPANQNPEWCGNLCCQHPNCTAWTFADPQPGTKVVDCWLKSGNTMLYPKVFPGVNLSSGFVGETTPNLVVATNTTRDSVGLTLPLDIRVFLDRSVVEVFVNGQVLTSIVIPSSESSCSARLWASSASPVVFSVDAWDMQGAFLNESNLWA